MRFIYLIKLMLIVAIGLSITTNIAFAQQLKIDKTRLIGTTGIEAVQDAIYDPRDKSIVFIGTTDSCGNGDIPSCSSPRILDNVMIAKIDSNKNISWIKVLGGSFKDYGIRIITTVDGGYAAAAHTGSTDGDIVGNHGAFAKDFWLIKLNNAGQVQWRKCYGSQYDEQINSITQTKDKGYIMAGLSNGSGGDVPFQYVTSQFALDWFVIKVDSSGNKQWAKTLGGTKDENDIIVLEAQDGYYLAGNSSSNDHECNDTSWHPGLLNQSSDFVLIHLDTLGNYLWNRTFGGSSEDQLNDAVWDPDDSTIMMAGFTTSIDYMVPTAQFGRWDILLMKVDRNGHLKWARTYGDNSIERFIRLKRTLSGNYIISCMAEINPPKPSYYYSQQQNDRLFLVDTAGVLITDKVVGGYDFENQCIGFSTSDGYTVCGTTGSAVFGEGIISPKHGITDAYISYILQWPTLIPNNDVEEKKVFNAFPNPVTNSITISIEGKHVDGILEIINSEGKLVYNNFLPSTKYEQSIKTDGWPKGIYIINWKAPTHASVSKRIIVK